VLKLAAITQNFFSTLQPKPKGIWLLGPTTAPDDGFIANLRIDSNSFACGFPSEPFPFGGQSLPKNVLLKPSGQTVTGNIGTTTACKPPVLTK
jgi:hypothetical protein